METIFLRQGVAIFFLAASSLPGHAQEVVPPTEFDDVFFAERQVNAAHLVVGVVAVERRRNAPARPRAIYLRQSDETALNELCGEVRSLDGLYFGEMRYSDLPDVAETGPLFLGYPSQKERVFDYNSADIAVRLNACSPGTAPPIYRVASWLGLEIDGFVGAEIMLNTQSGTDVFAFLGTEPVPCEPETEDTRQEVDFRCFIDATKIDASVPVSLFVDRSGSRDPVVQFFVSP